LAEALAEAGSLPQAALSVIKTFADLRHRIVHARESVSDDEILRAIDLGLILLRLINRRLPYFYVVERGDVEMFDDELMQKSRRDIQGVVLRKVSPVDRWWNVRFIQPRSTTLRGNGERPRLRHELDNPLN
jgi:hypothetical protein